MANSDHYEMQDDFQQESVSISYPNHPLDLTTPTTTGDDVRPSEIL